MLQEELDNAKAVDPPKQPSPQPESPKWSKDTHPAFQPGYRRPGAPSKPTDDTTTSPSYKVNDRVLARWISGDKAFHPARITSVTGSSADPVYIVTFKGYSDSENLRGQDLKPITNKPYSNENKKRVADEPPAPVVSTPPKPATKPSVISGEAIINPDFVDQARKEPSKVGDGPQRPAKAQRKVKANKELEAGKNKWQEFTSKGKFGKAAKKESMFRTGEGVNARGEALFLICPGLGSKLIEFSRLYWIWSRHAQRPRSFEARLPAKRRRNLIANLTRFFRCKMSYVCLATASVCGRRHRLGSLSIWVAWDLSPNRL